MGNYVTAPGFDRGDSIKYKSISGNFWAGMKSADLENQPSEQFILFEIFDKGAGKDKAGDDVLGKYEIVEVRKGELLMMQDDIKDLYGELQTQEEKLDKYGKNLTMAEKTQQFALKAKIAKTKEKIRKLESQYQKELAFTKEMVAALNYNTSFDLIENGEKDIESIKLQMQTLSVNKMKQQK